MRRLLIAGGGISGLCAAWRARSTGAAVEITLLERDRRLGGKILTERLDGWILEGAADGFLSRKPSGIALCNELGIAGRLQGQVPRKSRSFVMRAHALHPLPEGFSGLVPTDTRALQGSTLLSEEGKRRALQEPGIPPDPDAGDESVAQFMTRRFGREMFQALMEPLLSGIYAGDAECLSMRGTFPQLRQLELRHGSVMRGLEKEARARPISSLSPFVSFPGGMEELPAAIAARLADVGVLTGTEAVALRRAGTGYSVETADGGTFAAHALVLAVPPASASRLLAGIDPDLGRLHESIPVASTAVIHLGYKSSDIAHQLDGYGYVIPRIEGSDVLACTWTSSKWPDRAPRDMKLLRLYAGRHGGADMLQKSDDDLVALARTELARTLGITADPVLARVFRWPAAMPQYTLDHPKRVDAIEGLQGKLSRLFLAGAAYRGVGIPDCIESGFRAAEAAMESLK